MFNKTQHPDTAVEGRQLEEGRLFTYPPEIPRHAPRARVGRAISPRPPLPPTREILASCSLSLRVRGPSGWKGESGRSRLRRSSAPGRRSRAGRHLRSSCLPSRLRAQQRSRQAQAVALPVGLPLAQKCFFPLTPTLQSPVLGQHQASPRRRVSPGCGGIAFDKMRGEVGGLRAGHLQWGPAASGRGGCVLSAESKCTHHAGFLHPTRVCGRWRLASSQPGVGVSAPSG